VQKRGKIEKYVNPLGGKKWTGFWFPLHGNGIELNTQPMMERETAADHAHLGTELGTELLGKHLVIPLTGQKPGDPYHPGNAHSRNDSERETHPAPETAPECRPTVSPHDSDPNTKFRSTRK